MSLQEGCFKMMAAVPRCPAKQTVIMMIMIMIILMRIVVIIKRFPARDELLWCRTSLVCPKQTVLPLNHAYT